MHLYTAAQKFGISTIFNVFLKKFLLLIKAVYLIKNTEKKLILWNIITI